MQIIPPHGCPLTHTPLASQVCGVLPLHCALPGVQMPTHDPEPLTHAPLASHVCGVVPLHCVAPGKQTPLHVPAPLQT